METIILVDKMLTCCNGLPAEDNPSHYPNPCHFMAFGEDQWCIVTGKSVEENNDPSKTCPNFCPLVLKGDYDISVVHTSNKRGWVNEGEE